MMIGPGLSYVYFIQCEVNGVIKIGLSTNPETRFSQLQCSCPVALSRLALMRGHRRTESLLHVQFRQFREERGEWFRPDPSLLAFIVRKARLWTSAGETPPEVIRKRRDRAAENYYADILEFDRDHRRLLYSITVEHAKRSDVIGLA